MKVASPAGHRRGGIRPEVEEGDLDALLGLGDRDVLVVEEREHQPVVAAGDGARGLMICGNTDGRCAVTSQPSGVPCGAGVVGQAPAAGEPAGEGDDGDEVCSGGRHAASDQDERGQRPRAGVEGSWRQA